MNIILCTKNSNINYFEGIKVHERVSQVINGRWKNPPFYNTIVLCDDVAVKDYHVEQLWNCVLIDGKLIMPKKYSKLFNDVEKYAGNENYVIITRRDGLVRRDVTYPRTVDAIICGVQKASTSSLLVNLRKHPDIVAKDDEIHYFDINWKKGEGWLKDLHPRKGGKEIVLLKNPELIYLTNTHSMIQQVNPFVKLIVILRNPIDRAYSSWQMVKNNGWVYNTFEEAIDEELKWRMGENRTFFTAVYHYLQRGLYYQQLMDLLRWFPRQNIYICIMEHGIKYDEICDFLGIKCVGGEGVGDEKVRVGKYDKKMSGEVRRRLEDFYRTSIVDLENMLGYKTGWM